MKTKFFTTLLLLLSLTATMWAQQRDQSTMTGKVVTRSGRKAVEGAKVILDVFNPRVAYTDSEGQFRFESVPFGNVKLTVEASDFMTTELNVKVDTDDKNIALITLAADAPSEVRDESQFAEFDSDMVNDSQSTPVSLSASKDVFDNIAGYKFGALRFRTRGYDSGYEDVYLNGVLMNDATSGNSPWSLWSGLNEATRNQDVYTGLATTSFGTGGIAGSTNILARASQMRQGFRTSLVNANGQYRYRVMASYASGMQDNGWAYAFSVSTRQGGNDFAKGLNYNAWGYFLSAEKRFNDRNQLSFTFFGVPTERGAQMAATDEAYALTGDWWYNPNVGVQNGKLRNARMRKYHEPVAMVNWYHTIDENTKLEVNTAFRFGNNGYSALDWYSADDPKPDYHKNLPSYYYYKEEPKKAIQVAKDWLTMGDQIKYIDFDRLYNINYNSTDKMVDAAGNVIDGGRAQSHYIISERHADQRDFHINGKIDHRFSNNLNLTTGAEYRYNRTEYYNKAIDLLGGDYWLNIDNFADRDFGDSFVTNSVKNDISRTDNLVVREGDKYGYDYYAHIHNAEAWAVVDAKAGRFEFNAAGKLGYSTFWREGLYQKGLFPDNSLGESAKQSFVTYTAKGIVTYRPSGAHSISLSATSMSRAPHFQDAFVSPRAHNNVVSNLTTTKITGVDLSYTLRLPWIRMRLSGYYTTIKDQTRLISFYDDLNNAFTNFAMSGIDQRHIGMEFGFSMPIITDLTLSGAASVGDYIYTSEPTFTQTRDNSATVIAQNERVYWKNMKVESTPQLALNLGLNYKLPKNIYVGVDAEWFDNMYLSMNPLYRTATAWKGRVRQADIDAGTVAAGLPTIEEMMAQEKFDGALIMNANIGKSWYLGNTQLGFSLEVKNLLNNIARTGGFEQMRLREKDDQTTASSSYWTRFDSKYFYLYGRNYYLNIYFRF